MLFVDDDDAEPREANRFRKQGVRPHGEKRRFRFQHAERLLSGGSCVPAGKKDNGNAEGIEKGFHFIPVLLGEDFRRGHDGRLRLPIGGHKRGRYGDERLSRSDVALKQTIHRNGFRYVFPDFPDDSYLGFRRSEGERFFQKPFQERSAFRKSFRGFPRPVKLSPESETDLEQKEFLERQPVPRALPRDAIRRMVHFPDRFLRGGKLFRCADFRGEDIADVGETEINRRVHDSSEPFLGQSRRRVIDRNDPPDR